MDDGPGASEPHEGEPDGISSGPGRKNALTGVQLSLSDHQREQLAAEERLATWKAFAAPLAADAGAVIDDPSLVQLAVAVLAVFADHQSTDGLTFAQIHSGLAGRRLLLPVTVVSARLEHLHRMGFLEPYLPKLYQGRYIVRPAGLAGALAADRVADRGGVDELILLLDRTMAALQLQNPDPVQVLEHLSSCRNALLIFALDLRSRVATGTVTELITVGRQHDHASFTHQVADLNRLVTTKFPGRFDLEDAGAAVIEAEQSYRAQVRAAIDKVLAQGSAGLNFDVLAPAEYETAALAAGFDQLAQFGTVLIADVPPVTVDPATLIEVVEDYQPRSRTRVRPPEPIDTGRDPDPLGTAEAMHEAARRRRRLRLEALLAGELEADLTPYMRVGWDAAAQILTDAIALSADPQEPFVLSIADQLLVATDTPVTYLHPARITRTGRDVPGAGNNLIQADARIPGDPDDS